MSTFPEELRTKKYFFEECDRFHEQCGLRGFTLEQRERSFRAITHLWLTLLDIGGKDGEDINLRFEAERDNFERRWRYFLMDDARPMKEKLEAVEDAGS